MEEETRVKYVQDRFMCNKFKNIKGWPCRLQQEILATRYMKMSGATVKYMYMYFRPCSVDFIEGGATDVPILGPME